jgi:hypothetical protein
MSSSRISSSYSRISRITRRISPQDAEIQPRALDDKLLRSSSGGSCWRSKNHGC